MTRPGTGRPERPVHASGTPDHDLDTDRNGTDQLEDNPIWRQDNVQLSSVGIDVGTSGTQVAFTRLHLRRLGADLTSRYVVIGRVLVHQSPVRFTPYLEDRLIDADGLGEIVDDAYTAAGIDPDDVETGVVILTGEAIRRRNSERIVKALATTAGELVCAAAGHHMEAMLAAYGSGAAKASYDAGSRLLNVDIGGGTTKLALVDGGRVLDTAALHIGGRLLAVDEGGRISRLEPAGRDHAERAGHTLSAGDRVKPADLDAVAETMASALVTAITGGSGSPDVEQLYLTAPLDDFDGIAGIMFSGGVAEFIYERETREFGDLGLRLGAAIRRRLADGVLPYDLLPAGECIRATVLGASEFSVQLSGNTSYISDPDRLLPRRNLQVVRPEYELGDEVDPGSVSAAVRGHLETFGLAGSDDDVALALRWSGVPSYDRLWAFATGLRQALGDRLARGRPTYLVLDGDVALSLGAILRDELGVSGDLVALDGLSLWDFDYIDLGRLRFPSRTVPVTIKSLVFDRDPRADAVLPSQVEPHAGGGNRGGDAAEAERDAGSERLSNPADERSADRSRPRNGDDHE